jgi:hypothetical protein
MDSIRYDLNRVALGGTERATLSDTTLAWIQHAGGDAHSDSADILLLGLTLCEQWQRLQLPIKPFDGALPTPVPQEDYCSREVERYLQLVLAGPHRRALDECLLLAHAAHCLLPPLYLPELFGLCLQGRTSQRWHWLRPLIGARGLWLLAQRADWQKKVAKYEQSEESVPSLANWYESHSAKAAALQHEEAWYLVAPQDFDALFRYLDEGRQSYYSARYRSILEFREGMRQAFGIS